MVRISAKNCHKNMAQNYANGAFSFTFPLILTITIVLLSLIPVIPYTNAQSIARETGSSPQKSPGEKLLTGSSQSAKEEQSSKEVDASRNIQDSISSRSEIKFDKAIHSGAQPSQNNQYFLRRPDNAPQESVVAWKQYPASGQSDVRGGRPPSDVSTNKKAKISGSSDGKKQQLSEKSGKQRKGETIADPRSHSGKKLVSSSGSSRGRNNGAGYYAPAWRSARYDYVASQGAASPYINAGLGMGSPGLPDKSIGSSSSNSAGYPAPYYGGVSPVLDDSNIAAYNDQAPIFAALSGGAYGGYGGYGGGGGGGYGGYGGGYGGYGGGSGTGGGSSKKVTQPSKKKTTVKPKKQQVTRKPKKSTQSSKKSFQSTTVRSLRTYGPRTLPSNIPGARLQPFDNLDPGHLCSRGDPILNRVCGPSEPPCPLTHECDVRRGIDQFGKCCIRVDLCPDFTFAIAGLTCRTNTSFNDCGSGFRCVPIRLNNGIVNQCCNAIKPGTCPSVTLQDQFTSTLNYSIPLQPIATASPLINVVAYTIPIPNCGGSCLHDFSCPGSQKCCLSANGCPMCTAPNLMQSARDPTLHVSGLSDPIANIRSPSGQSRNGNSLSSAFSQHVAKTLKGREMNDFSSSSHNLNMDPFMEGVPVLEGFYEKALDNEDINSGSIGNRRKIAKKGKGLDHHRIPVSLAADAGYVDPALSRSLKSAGFGQESSRGDDFDPRISRMLRSYLKKVNKKKRNIETKSPSKTESEHSNHLPASDTAEKRKESKVGHTDHSEGLVKQLSSVDTAPQTAQDPIMVGDAFIDGFEEGSKKKNFDQTAYLMALDLASKWKTQSDELRKSGNAQPDGTIFIPGDQAAIVNGQSRYELSRRKANHQPDWLSALYGGRQSDDDTSIRVETKGMLETGLSPSDVASLGSALADAQPSTNGNLNAGSTDSQTGGGGLSGGAGLNGGQSGNPYFDPYYNPYRGVNPSLPGGLSESEQVDQYLNRLNSVGLYPTSYDYDDSLAEDDYPSNPAELIRAYKGKPLPIKLQMKANELRMQSGEYDEIGQKISKSNGNSNDANTAFGLPKPTEKPVTIDPLQFLLPFVYNIKGKHSTMAPMPPLMLGKK